MFCGNYGADTPDEVNDYEKTVTDSSDAAEGCENAATDNPGKTKHCENCGTENPDVARYCENCGNAIEPVDTAERKSFLTKNKIAFETKKIIIAAAVVAVIVGGVFLVLSRFGNDKADTKEKAKQEQKKEEEKVVEIPPEDIVEKWFSAKKNRDLEALISTYPEELQKAVKADELTMVAKQAELKLFGVFEIPIVKGELAYDVINKEHLSKEDLKSAQQAYYDDMKEKFDVSSTLKFDDGYVFTLGMDFVVNGGKSLRIDTFDIFVYKINGTWQILE